MDHKPPGPSPGAAQSPGYQSINSGFEGLERVKYFKELRPMGFERGRRLDRGRSVIEHVIVVQGPSMVSFHVITI